MELGSHDGGVEAVAALADGRVVTGGLDLRVRVWDPAAPGTVPVELGSHDGWVRAVAALADGRVVTGGSDLRVRVWDPAAAGTAPVELTLGATTVTCLHHPGTGAQRLVVAHQGQGLSFRSVRRKTR